MRKIFDKIHHWQLNAKTLYSTKSKRKFQNPNKPDGSVIISCKNPDLNHYTVNSNKFDAVPLASKGWTHSKSIGDYFVVHPHEEKFDRIYTFGEMGLHPNIINELSTQQILKATEFQFRASEAVQTGSHLLLAAETGCGKTFSYLLPIVQKIVDKGAGSNSLNTPKAVILLPNRELAYQVGDVASTICSSVGVKTKVLVGGRTKSLMMNPNFEEIDILVATPGALAKLSSVGIYKLNEVQFLVFDEADTLLDNSFVEIISKLIGRMSQSQMILVSATVPQMLPDILKPLEDNLKQVISPKIHRPLLNITQTFLRLSHSRKASHLLQLAKNNKDPMIIFTNKNERCNWLALFLRENGVKCSNINGDMNYAIRIEQWNQFVRGDTNILSATDVASRGIDTVKVRHLLNYDFPLHAADYIHRIGRIGRLGSHELCKATNYIVTDREVALLQQIELAIRKDQPIPNVDGNITAILQMDMRRRARETM